VHGGGFTGGDRRHAVAPLREALSDGDFVWFSIDYRLAPAFKPGDASDDLDAALGFIRHHALQFKVDPSRIALVGESAGGYLVLTAASRLGGAQLKAVVAVGGPAQLWTLAPEIVAHVETAFGVKGEAGLRSVSPISHVHTSMPPILLLHGSADSHVPLAQAEAMCQAMKNKRQSCELHVIQGGGHSANEWAALPASGGFPPVLKNWLASRLTIKP
jgi:alpha-L-fucosidase 2